MKNKFRVYNSKTKKWVHGPGHEVSLIGEAILLGTFLNGVSIEEYNDLVVLQYIGQNDIDGKEIYEGDTLQWTENDGDECADSIQTFSGRVVFKCSMYQVLLCYTGRRGEELHYSRVIGNFDT